MKFSAGSRRQVLKIFVGQAIKVVQHHADVVVSAPPRRIAGVGKPVIWISGWRISVIRISASARIAVWRITIWRITVGISPTSDDDRRSRKSHDIGLPAASTRRGSTLSAGNCRRRRTRRNTVSGGAAEY